MFLIKDAFATVWSVEDKGNYVQGRISTSEKDNREEGKYINSSWFARFVGNAKGKALDLSERDRIKILSGKVTNTLYGEGENKKTFLNVIVFDFEMLNGASYSNNDSKTSNTQQQNNNTDDDLPF